MSRSPKGAEKRHWTFLAACAALCVASASEKPRAWQEGTLVSAEMYKEAPAPSDAVAVTESDRPGRVMINRALEKLMGLPGQRSWTNFWAYVIDTDTRRYIAISKRAVNIPLEGTVRCVAGADHIFVLDDGGKEQKLKLVKVVALNRQNPANVQKPQPQSELAPRAIANIPGEQPAAPEPLAEAIPSPPAPPPKVQLTIDCVPGPGSIEVNGKPAGLTPLTISLDPGVVALVIRRAGYVVWAPSVLLQAGSTVTLKAELKPVVYVTQPQPSAAADNPHPDGPSGSITPAAKGMTAPVVLYKVDPEYSAEARALRLYGTVVLQLTVDSSGRARDIRVLRSLAFGLDEKAIEAVSKWKFRPGFRDGQPVAVMATIEMNFRLI